MIISIEIMLLAITLLILINSFGFNDNIGQIFSIYIIALAGAESVIGLSILIAYYRFKTSIFLNFYNLLRFKSYKNEFPNYQSKILRSYNFNCKSA